MPVLTGTVCVSLLHWAFLSVLPTGLSGLEKGLEEREMTDYVSRVVYRFPFIILMIGSIVACIPLLVVIHCFELSIAAGEQFPELARSGIFSASCLIALMGILGLVGFIGYLFEEEPEEE